MAGTRVASWDFDFSRWNPRWRILERTNLTLYIKIVFVEKKKN